MEYIQCAIDGFEKDKKIKTVKTDLKFAVKSVSELSEDDMTVGKKAGKYITYDLKKRTFEDCSDFIENFGADIFSLAKRKGNPKTVLVVGLGNTSFECDKLGALVTSKIKITRQSHQGCSSEFSGNDSAERSRGKKTKISVCCAVPEVLSKTGINSSEFVAGICDKIKPDLVIACDTLCTSNLSRINNSFQLSDTGIKPGGGVGAETGDISESSLKIPVLAIGVPLVLKTSGLIFDCINVYEGLGGKSVDMKRFGEMILKEPSKYVTPKEIDFYVENTAAAIAGAIDYAFGN